MSVSIFTMTHKKFEDPKDRIYIPLHVGRECSADLGYLGDNTGDNISIMNCYYSELTGMYWVWKNFKASDYIGMCHYRRYLVNENDIIFNENDYNRILKNYDIITTKKLRLNFEYYYGYSVNYNINDLMVTGEVLSEKYPEYYKNFAEMIHGNETYFGNILVTSHKLFNEYSAWLFDILFEVQKRIDLNAYTDDYHRRVFGFISEFLLTLWVRTRNLKVYESKVGMTTEKYETRVMKERLSAYFKKRDIEGAKEYFIKSLEKRPDVLMEASDITGELKLSMQVTATSDIEFRTYGKSILDDNNEFESLIRYFSDLNSIVNRYIVNQNTQTDKDYLQENRISKVSIQVAVEMFCTNPVKANEVLYRITEDVK